ncbi:MAG: hypothetical protein V7L00_09935 [Nostoc sp.]|uniref:hypothetical protein n=1 Tax=unclassified Nostoc TaxID=2593658 RepID=UPI0025E9F54B|nr:hypothetical protein [Nostoc sp. JL33]MBN3872229.1 hypothetical protein [Nostoc sp. JL33]
MSSTPSLHQAKWQLVLNFKKHGALGIGHWALGIGHGALVLSEVEVLGMGHW